LGACLGIALSFAAARGVSAQDSQHGTAQHETSGEHSGAAAQHGAGGHAEEHHQEFNWYYGMIGEKAGAPPGLLWRAPGTPPPFAAQLLNAIILFGFIIKFAREPIARGLAGRRQRIMRGMDEAAAMLAEAKKQLEFYKQRIDNLDAEVERVRREMRESAEAERQRILTDAQARRARLEQEARLLVEQEMKAVQEALTRETAMAAVRSARTLLQQSTSTEDHRRLCEQYLEGLRQQARPGAPGSVRSQTT